MLHHAAASISKQSASGNARTANQLILATRQNTGYVHVGRSDLSAHTFVLEFGQVSLVDVVEAAAVLDALVPVDPLVQLQLRDLQLLHHRCNRATSTRSIAATSHRSGQCSISTRTIAATSNRSGQVSAQHRHAPSLQRHTGQVSALYSVLRL